jgi:hypothetical protein
MFEANVLLQQLSELGRLLDVETEELGDLDMIATGLGCHYSKLREAYEDTVAENFLQASSESGVEAKKMAARLKSVPARLVAQEANLEWEKAKSKVRSQQAKIKAITTRIEIGRSLLSHEKTRMDLDRLPHT